MLEEQKNKINDLESRIDTDHAIQSVANTTNIENSVILYQNTPNPFNQLTSIKYYLPNTVNSGSIVIFDLNGRLLKTITINQKGEGSITINANDLQPGMFIYALIADGKEVATKRMILTK